MQGEYSKSYSTSADIFRGKLNRIPDFRYLSSFAFSDSSRSSPVTEPLVMIVTHTQLFLSQTSILMCNGLLSNWNGNQIELEKFNGKKFHCKNFHWMLATTKIFYHELYSREYFQQQIFPKLQYLLITIMISIKNVHAHHCNQ